MNYWLKQPLRGARRRRQGQGLDCRRSEEHPRSHGTQRHQTGRRPRPLFQHVLRRHSGPHGEGTIPFEILVGFFFFLQILTISITKRSKSSSRISATRPPNRAGSMKVATTHPKSLRPTLQRSLPCILRRMQRRKKPKRTSKTQQQQQQQRSK